MCKKLTLLATLSFVLSLVLAGPTHAALVAWWRLDEGSGTTAIDSSDNGYDGVLVGGAQWVDGQLDGAIQFNGADSFVRAPNIPLNNRTFTIAMWVNPDLYTDQQVIFGQHQSGSQNLSMHYRIYGPGSGRIRMGFYSNDLDTTMTLDEGNWYHLTFWYDFENQTRRIYVDGIQQAEDNPSPYLGTSGDTRIGQWNNNQWFRGIIDDVQIYDHALTDNEILAVMRGIKGYPNASRPNPEDGAILEDTWVTLSWRAGDFAVSHDVYVGENFDDVNDATNASDTFQGNQGETFFMAGFPGFAYPEGLVPGTMYYWRIDEVNEADPNSPWKGPVWSFFIPPRTAYDPSPADGAKFVAMDTTLSWMSGFNAKLHTVYFGDDLDTVSNAAGGAPQATTTYDPGPLEDEKTYYWRVDEFDGATTHTGNVWTFTTIPDILITDPNLVGWWKLDEGVGHIALDWSGHGNHGALQGDPQWVPGQVGGAMEFDGTGDYVDCGNGPSLGITGDITFMCWIKVAAFTKTWETILAKGDDSYRMSRGPGDGDSIHFGCNGPTGGNLNATAIVTTNTWRHVALRYDGSNKIIYIDGVEDARVASTGAINSSTYNFAIGENLDATGRNLTGLVDDVRIYNRALTVEEIQEAMRGEPDLAWGPSPANGSTPDVTTALPLTWSPGDFAAQHDVYFGTDKDALEGADESDTLGIYRGRQTATSYTPPEGVEWGGGPYYWRIDEYNTDGTLSKGRIWSFTVTDFLLVDDFESYTDNDPEGEAIWQHWIDGYGVAGNGSQVGELLPPYAEQTIVHGGIQSMPLYYNNTGGVTNSEAELTLTAQRDWTTQGVAELSLWVHGLPGSVGSFTESPAGTYTMTGSGADIWNNGPAGDRHDEFQYAYKTLTGAGSITARVVSVQNTNGWAKAGVMIRETLDGGSKHAFACITPSNGVASQGRDMTGGDSFNTNEGGITAPHWVKLERDMVGNFTVNHSADGTNWQPVQGATPRNIPMSSSVYIGLALTSHDAALTCEAVFSNVTTTGNVSGQWQNQDIGITSNAAEPLYVAISNAAGAPAVVANADPLAVTIDAWTEWRVPLQDFADQGINLRNVDKIAIGLGSQSGIASAGGSGVIYVDDIRLWRQPSLAGYRPAP